MNEELKPCPFCKVEIKLTGANYYFTKWYFKCIKCKIKTTIYRKTKGGAIKAWNKRVK